jgi:hypothetical protein
MLVSRTQTKLVACELWKKGCGGEAFEFDGSPDWPGLTNS